MKFGSTVHSIKTIYSTDILRMSNKGKGHLEGLGLIFQEKGTPPIVRAHQNFRSLIVLMNTDIFFLCKNRK